MSSALAAVVQPAPAGATARTWTGGSFGVNTSWDDPSNWSPAGVPADGDTVLISRGNASSTGDNTVTYNYPGPAITLTSLNVTRSTAFGAANSSVLSIPSGNLSATTEYVADTGGSNGRGRVNQSGGVNTASSLDIGHLAGNVGTYNLSGSGQLTTSSTFLGDTGTGFFNQSAGSHNTGSLQLALQAGSAATYAFSGGVLSTGTEFLGYSGTASFVQSAGTHTASGFISLAHKDSFAVGSYSLAGTGSLSTPTFYIGEIGTGSFTQTGGSVSVANEEVGVTGVGSVDHSAGSNAVSTQLYVAYNAVSTGTYSLSGTASLSAPDEDIGYGGTGAFVQSGGVNSTSLFHLGFNGNTTGTYSLSGTGSLSSSSENIGHSGTGYFVQSGGTNADTGNLSLGVKFSGATGSYSLSGGSLSAPNELVGAAGNGSFAQTGGTNGVSGTLTLAYSPGSIGSYTLSGGFLYAANTTVNSNGVFHYDGGNATFGALTLNGTGKLLLTAGASQTLLVSGLSIAPTTYLDLIDNRMLLAFSGSPSSDLTLLRQYLASGQLTSASATADASHRTALGYADNGLSQILVKYTYLGDANLDGRVDADDYALIDKGYATGASTWSLGDFNYDGVVNAADYLLIDRVFTQQGNPLSPDLLSQRESQFGPDYVSALTASLPEPAGATVLLLTTHLLLTRRLRKLST